MEKIQESTPLRAARAFLASRSRQHLQRGARAQRNPTTPSTPTITIASIARQYRVARSAVARHVKALEDGYANGATSPAGAGRPRALTDAEDTALTAFVIWLERCGCPGSPGAIVAAANDLRASRVPPAPAVSKNWLSRWMRDHPELQKSGSIRPRELTRASVEMDPTAIVQFFDNYEANVQTYGLGPSAIWNMDEAGCRIGCLNGRMQVIVTRVGRRTIQPEVLDPANRESCTLLGCGNATGSSTPAYVIFKTWPITAWDDANCDDDIRFTASPTGFSNGDVMMDWIKHFNAMSYRHTQSFVNIGITLEDWFGCDHLGLVGGRGPPTTPGEATLAGLARRADYPTPIYRLLLMDGFAGHWSIELMQYCIQYDIVIGFFPPHLTHLLQPMDVGVFQHLKAEHQKALYAHISRGNLTFNRVDFITHLSAMWRTTFTTAHLMTGFEKAGIWPISRHTPLEALAAKKRSRVVPGLANMLPKSGRRERAVVAASHINAQYRQQFSSPTRQAFDDILATLGEAVTMARALNSHIQSRETRLQQYQKQRRTRKKVAPSSDFVTSVTAGEIRAAAEAEARAAHADLVKVQMRRAKKAARDDEEGLKRQWRDDKAIQRQLHGRELDRTFRGWLDRTGAGRDYVPFDPKDPRWAMPGDPVRLRDDELFVMDVENGGISDSLRQQIAASRRPLEEIRLRLGSEESVEFLGLDPGPSTQGVVDPDLQSDDEWDVGLPSSPPDSTPSAPPRTESRYQTCMRIIREGKAKAADDARLAGAPHTQ